MGQYRDDDHWEDTPHFTFSNQRCYKCCVSVFLTVLQFWGSFQIELGPFLSQVCEEIFQLHSGNLTFIFFFTQICIQLFLK